MKTVKEIALDLEVSQVTVYNHIKKLDKKLMVSDLKLLHPFPEVTCKKIGVNGTLYRVR